MFLSWDLMETFPTPGLWTVTGHSKRINKILHLCSCFHLLLSETEVSGAANTLFSNYFFSQTSGSIGWILRGPDPSPHVLSDHVRTQSRLECGTVCWRPLYKGVWLGPEGGPGPDPLGCRHWQWGVIWGQWQQYSKSTTISTIVASFGITQRRKKKTKVFKNLFKKMEIWCIKSLCSKNQVPVNQPNNTVQSV